MHIFGHREKEPMGTTGSSSPKLSIVIPTTLQRTSILGTVESLKQAMTLGIRVEVVINNPEPDPVLKSRLEEFEYVDVRMSSKTWPTAEASAMSAAYTSSADWVWILGDDDVATTSAMTHILTLISSNVADFWLLNIQLRQVVLLDYYRVDPETCITSVQDAWGKMGWISITTTLSAFLIRRSVIDWKLFLRFHSIQGIYSHSFSLFCMLLGKQVGLTNHICVDRHESESEEIGKSLEHYQLSLGRSRNYTWTTGLRKLIREASKISGIPKRTLWRFEESEIVKPPGETNADGTPFSILIGPTLSVFLRHKIRPGIVLGVVNRLFSINSVVRQAPVTIKFRNLEPPLS